MGVIRRSSLQVQLDRLKELKRLEKQKKALEKDAANTESPLHWAAVAAAVRIAALIATIVRQIKKRRKR